MIIDTNDHPRFPIKAVIFDLGGVVYTSPFTKFATLEASYGLSPGAIRSVNAQNPDHNAWAQFERGDIDYSVFEAKFSDELADSGLPFSAAEVIACLHHDPVPEMVAAIKQLAQFVKLGAITNNVTPMLDTPAELRPIEVIIESAVVGVRKPEPAIYEMALSRLAVPAQATVMLDDLGINLKPARDLGMHTIKVTEPRDALVELGRLLGRDLLALGV